MNLRIIFTHFYLNSLTGSEDILETLGCSLKTQTNEFPLPEPIVAELESEERTNMF